MSSAEIIRTPERELKLSKRPILSGVVVAIAYLVGCEIAFLIGTLSDKIFAPFWPPNIVLLCALVFTPTRNWWIYILAAFPAHVVAESAVGMPIPQMLVAFATNCLVATLNALAMRKLLGGPPWFGSLRKAILYVLATALVNPALVALGGAFVPILGPGPHHGYWADWLQWYLSNALSSLTLGPVALIALSPGSFFVTLTTRQKIESIALAIALAVVSMLALRISVDRILGLFMPALVLLPLALTIWSAIRFGAPGASAAILVTTVAAIQQTLNGPSPFIVASPEATVLGLQIFLIVLAAPMLLLGAATEETRNAVQVARTNEQLMALSAIAADSCLWQYDRKSECFWMTENGRQMFGLDASDPLTRVSIEQRVHPEDRQAATDAMRAAAATNSLADTEFRVARPNGEVRWIRARGRAVQDGRQNKTILSGTFADITERKIAEREAALKQREIARLMRVSMLGELSGGIAHELMQPLTAILSNAQAARALLDNKLDMKEIKKTLDDIIRDNNRASEVIHRMRTFLRRSEAKSETVDLNDIIRSTLQLLHSELINRRIKVTCALDSSLSTIRGDRVQLQQVLLNLIMNAADSMNDQATTRRMMTIATRRLNEREIEITVADRGTGLSAAQQQQIFQPFFTTKERGLGLGLSICSSIIRAHGGSLGLENNSVGGVTATFTLPRLG
jgi:PAS domain S-box-containing protein